MMNNLSDDDSSSVAAASAGADLLINRRKAGGRSVDGGSVHSIRVDDGGATDIDADSIDIEQLNDGAFGSVGGGGGGGGGGGAGHAVSECSSESSRYGRARTETRHMSPEDIMNQKRELLYQFTRMEKKGMHVPKHFTLGSSLDEMQHEFERLKRDHEIDASVRFQRRMLMACVSGIEFMNNKFDPFEVYLDGWSESVQEGINDYDDIFEELWDKYHGKVKMAPELRLMFTLGGSAVWFHMSHAMFRSTMPGVEQVLKQNPELRKQFMEATMNTMKGGNAAPARGGGGGIFGSIGNMMGGMFGGGGGGGGAGGGPPPPAHHGRGGSASMRGPADVDELLSEINDEGFGDYGGSDGGGAPEMFEIFSDGDSVVAEPHTPPARRGGNGKGRRPRQQQPRKSIDIM
jgi:hypothetical protein